MHTEFIWVAPWEIWFLHKWKTKTANSCSTLQDDQQLCFCCRDSIFYLVCWSEILSNWAILYGCAAWFVSDLVGSLERGYLATRPISFQWSIRKGVISSINHNARCSSVFDILCKSKTQNLQNDWASCEEFRIRHQIWPVFALSISRKLLNDPRAKTVQKWEGGSMLIKGLPERIAQVGVSWTGSYDFYR